MRHPVLAAAVAAVTLLALASAFAAPPADVKAAGAKGAAWLRAQQDVQEVATVKQWGWRDAGMLGVRVDGGAVCAFRITGRRRLVAALEELDVASPSRAHGRSLMRRGRLLIADGNLALPFTGLVLRDSMTMTRIKNITDDRTRHPDRTIAAVQRQLAALASRRDERVGDIAPELAQLEAELTSVLTVFEQARERQRSTQLERVIDAMLPDEVPSAPVAWHAQQSAEARAALLREWGAWSATEVADRAGSTASNRGALASSWRTSGRVLAVEWHGRPVYPAFQFTDDSQPRPELVRILGHLRRAGLTDWQAALWFATETGWLDDRRPIDLLDEEPDAVEAAAANFDQRPT